MLYKKPNSAQKFIAVIYAAVLSFLIIKGIAPWEWEKPPSGLQSWETSTELGRILSFNSAQERIFKISAVSGLYALIAFGAGYACFATLGSVFQPYRITAQSVCMAIVIAANFWLLG